MLTVDVKKRNTLLSQSTEECDERTRRGAAARDYERPVFSNAAIVEWAYNLLIGTAPCGVCMRLSRTPNQVYRLSLKVTNALPTRFMGRDSSKSLPRVSSFHISLFPQNKCPEWLKLTAKLLTLRRQFVNGQNND